MNWFLIALIAPIVWSIVNHIDKYMLSKYLKERGLGALLIFSALSSVIILPFVLYFFMRLRQSSLWSRAGDAHAPAYTALFS